MKMRKSGSKTKTHIGRIQPTHLFKHQQKQDVWGQLLAIKGRQTRTSDETFNLDSWITQSPIKAEARVKEITNEIETGNFAWYYDCETKTTEEKCSCERCLTTLALAKQPDVSDFPLSIRMTRTFSEPRVSYSCKVATGAFPVCVTSLDERKEPGSSKTKTKDQLSIRRQFLDRTRIRTKSFKPIASSSWDSKLKSVPLLTTKIRRSKSLPSKIRPCCERKKLGSAETRRLRKVMEFGWIRFRICDPNFCKSENDLSKKDKKTKCKCKTMEGPFFQVLFPCLASLESHLQDGETKNKNSWGILGKHFELLKSILYSCGQQFLLQRNSIRCIPTRTTRSLQEFSCFESLCYTFKAINEMAESKLPYRFLALYIPVLRDFCWKFLKEVYLQQKLYDKLISESDVESANQIRGDQTYLEMVTREYAKLLLNTTLQSPFPDLVKQTTISRKRKESAAPSERAANERKRRKEVFNLQQDVTKIASRVWKGFIPQETRHNNKRWFSNLRNLLELVEQQMAMVCDSENIPADEDGLRRLMKLNEKKLSTRCSQSTANSGGSNS
jgi:hypothetical protein